MPFLPFYFPSAALGVQASVNVILPHTRPDASGKPFAYKRKKYPTLYLLHGLSDDHTIWSRRTSIERYVEPLEIAVVMPFGGRSFYTDMTHGGKFWTFISEELPALMRHYFPLSDSPKDTFVAGLSMGGYGAFKLALRNPDRFAAAASFSGALDMARAAKGERGSDWSAEMRNIFGPPNKIAGSDNDLLHLATQVARSKGPKPKLYQACGTEDFLYADNVRFRDHAKALGLDLTYTEEPGGHEWWYWDKQIQKVIDWLPLRRS